MSRPSVMAPPFPAVCEEWEVSPSWSEPLSAGRGLPLSGGPLASLSRSTPRVRGSVAVPELVTDGLPSALPGFLPRSPRRGS